MLLSFLGISCTEVNVFSNIMTLDSSLHVAYGAESNHKIRSSKVSFMTISTVNVGSFLFEAYVHLLLDKK